MALVLVKNTLEQSIYSEQVKLIYTNMRVVFLGNIIAIVVLYAVFWGVGNVTHKSIWITLMSLLLFIRFLDMRKFLGISRGSDFNAEFWEWRLILGVLLSGIMWGVLFLLLLTPQKAEYVLFIVCGYASLVAAANAAFSARVRVFLAYLIPASLPLSFATMFAGGSLYFIMGIAFLIYVLANIIVSRTFNRIIYDAIRLRYENLNLIDELKVQKELAEQAVLAKDTFLASASHDLRQPLHAQGLYLDAIEENVKPEGKQQLKSIRKTNEALSNLFNSLLDVSRLNAGIVNVKKEHVSLRDVLSPVVDEFRGYSERSGIKLELACPQALTVIADHVLVKRVVRNLLSNAFRYTHEGSVVIQCLSNDDNTVRVSVIDTGIGIPESEIDKIFLEYHQLDNPERDREKGLGLGLSIVKKLCNLMQTPLECLSNTGEGSSFSMILPKSNIKLLDIKSREDLQSVKGTHVLVIDDEEDILEGMSQLLSNWGCLVTVAESENEALTKLSNKKVASSLDLIIADYRLRENKTGAEAILRVHDFLKREVCAVIITGDTSENRLKEATRNGFYLLHKPVSPARLRTVLIKSLQKA